MYFECTYRVPYADTDQMGVVYYANYFEYFERGRTEMLRSVGAPYSVLEQEGVFLPVIEAHCDYFGSAKYDDLLTFRSYVESRSRIKLKICTEVLRENELLVRGYVVLGCVNAAKRPVRLPESLAACCDKLMWNPEMVSPEELYPLKFAPIYQERIWGGNQMTEVLKRELPEHSAPIGEAWELCDRDGIQSKVVNGKLAGVTLSELVKNYRKYLLGTKAADAERFPLLMKLIDSGEKLSLQVHPDDAACSKIGGGAESKTEMWYILSARPGADILAGLNAGLSENKIVDSLRAGETDDLLQIYPSQTRDAYFIPSGTLHAIGAGNLILEIQQNSDTTYRISDWGRKGPDGKMRELHLEKGLQSINFTDRTSPRVAASAEFSGNCENAVAKSLYFNVTELRLTELQQEDTGKESFHYITAVDTPVKVGRGEVFVELSPGESVLLPAAFGAYTIQALTPGVICTVVKTTL
ncbi:MAG: YbgC/FadM family acyl-CoA thioesterase [Lentisphaerae bacterium]|nr:YbgC/FadM family acyl-CoA thioesterase [Lentisphaerota bacterium]